MSKDRIAIYATVPGILVVIPDINFRREWRSTKLPVYVTKMQFENMQYDYGTREMFHRGLLYIPEEETIDELDREDLAPVGKFVSDKEARLALVNPNTAMLADLLKDANEAGVEVIIEEAKKMDNLTLKTMSLIKDATGVNIEFYLKEKAHAKQEEEKAKKE